MGKRLMSLFFFPDSRAYTTERQRITSSKINTQHCKVGVASNKEQQLLANVDGHNLAHCSLNINVTVGRFLQGAHEPTQQQLQSNKCVIRKRTLLLIFTCIKHGTVQCRGDSTRYKLLGCHPRTKST